MHITALTCVKNEGPFILEWIAFHKLLGVTDFLFYSNDCTDGTDRLLDALAARGGLKHLPNPAQGRNYQMEALKHAKDQPNVTEADWVWVADVDEFLNIHAGDGRIPDLIAACGDPQAISVHFQFFANDGVEAFRDQPVISQFTRSHNPDLWCGDTAIEVKTLTRRDFPLQYFGAHRPFFRKNLPSGQRPRWTDAAGRDVPHRFLVAAHPRRMRAGLTVRDANWTMPSRQSAFFQSGTQQHGSGAAQSLSFGHVGGLCGEGGARPCGTCQ